MLYCRNVLTHIALGLLDVDYLKAGPTDALKNPETWSLTQIIVRYLKLSFQFLQADLEI